MGGALDSEQYVQYRSACANREATDNLEPVIGSGPIRGVVPQRRSARSAGVGLRHGDHPRDLGEVVGVLAGGVGRQLLHRDPPVLTVVADPLPARASGLEIVVDSGSEGDCVAGT
jgi:hypothetical protein